MPALNMLLMSALGQKRTLPGAETSIKDADCDPLIWNHGPPGGWRRGINVCLKIASFQRLDLVDIAHGRVFGDSKERCPCPTNSLINARQCPRIAQPALRSCGSLE
jgi:hypothetical protein